jgi:broad specificity phosphatase PhoE
MVRLYLIRHGDPDYDTDKANGGTLTEHGKAEATALATFLAKEGITHAYTSPMGRAKLTAQLGLGDIRKFSALYNDFEDIKSKDEEKEKDSVNGGSKDVDQSKQNIENEDMRGDKNGDSYNSTAPCKQNDRPRNNFERNVLIEEWCKELSTWRCTEDYQTHPRSSSSSTKPPAIWDIPAPIIRSQLYNTSQGIGVSETESQKGQVESQTQGWPKECPDYGAHEVDYRNFCQSADEFLSRHGIIRPISQTQVGKTNTKNRRNHYYMSQEVIDNKEKRCAKIAIFCHNGMALTLISHLLAIPLPMVHVSMWLAPSSVTTILFDEYPANKIETILSNKDEGKGKVSQVGCHGGEGDIDSIIVIPKAICIGGTNHLTLAGLSVPTSKYEQNKRPSGIKHNFY